MTDYYLPDDEPVEDISYENFDDMLWEEGGEPEPIDLAALDDALPAEPGPARAEDTLDAATEDLLDALDDALPLRSAAPTPEDRGLAAFAAPPASLAEDTDDFLAALDDALPAEPGPARAEDALSAETEDLLDALDDALPLRSAAPTPEDRGLAAFAAPAASLAEDTDDFLAALDDALPAEPGPARAEDALDTATEDLLDALDDALAPRSAAPTPEVRGLAAFAAPPASLAEDTDDFLAALDDALPAEPGPARAEDTLSTATEDLLDALDDALAPPIAAVPVLAPAPRPAPISAARGAILRRPAARLPVEPVYQVLLALPPELGAQVLELRATGNVEDMPPPGIPLTPRFHTSDLEALDAALERWARGRLPLLIEIATVQAEILGERQYVAAWTVTLDDRLRAALHALKRALSGLVKPLPDEPGTLRLRVTIGERIPARRYPHVLSLMQRDFEPAQWPVQTLMLAVYAGDDAPPDWDIAAIYAGQAPPSAV